VQVDGATVAAGAIPLSSGGEFAARTVPQATTDDDVTNYVHSDEKAQNNDANWPPLMGRSATTPDSGKCDMQPLYLGGFVRAHCGEFVA